MPSYLLATAGSRAQGFFENSRRGRPQNPVLAAKKVIGARDRDDFHIVLGVLPRFELRKVDKRIGIPNDDTHGYC